MTIHCTWRFSCIPTGVTTKGRLRIRLLGLEHFAGAQKHQTFVAHDVASKSQAINWHNNYPNDVLTLSNRFHHCCESPRYQCLPILMEIFMEKTEKFQHSSIRLRKLREKSKTLSQQDIICISSETRHLIVSKILITLLKKSGCCMKEISKLKRTTRTTRIKNHTLCFLRTVHFNPALHRNKRC